VFQRNAYTEVYIVRSPRRTWRIEEYEKPDRRSIIFFV